MSSATYLYLCHLASIDDLRSESQSRTLKSERSLVTRQMSDREMVTMAVMADTRSLDTNFMSVACATNL